MSKSRRLKFEVDEDAASKGERTIVNDFGMDVSSIMTLPEEARSLIFNLIPQTETVNLRLVCRAWNQEIQNNYVYIIKNLDEDSPHFNSILQLQIKHLEIYQLESTPILNLDGTCIFKHPNAIRNLVIVENSLVAQLNLQLLIGLVSKNLLLLDVYLTPKICSYRFPSHLFFNFKHLKHLSIHEANDDFEECEDNSRSLFHLLENSSFANLKILRVDLILLEMTYEMEARIVGNIFRLISKQGKYLEELIVNVCLHSNLIKLPVPLQEEELLRIKQIQTLKRVSLELRSLKLGKNRFWDEFLRNQKQLEQLRIVYFCRIYSVSLIHQIILNNSATLDKLEIAELQMSPTDPPFDLSMFQSCQGLKVLKLGMEYYKTRPRTNPEAPDVVNFDRLPANIITLELYAFKVLSDELLTAFRSGAKGFQNLQELELLYCGDQGQVGINAGVLHEIMITPRPNLTKVEFHGIHKGGAAMKTVLDQLQISDDDTNFRLKRYSGEFGWAKW